MESLRRTGRPNPGAQESPAFHAPGNRSRPGSGNGGRCPARHERRPGAVDAGDWRHASVPRDPDESAIDRNAIPAADAPPTRVPVFLGA